MTTKTKKQGNKAVRNMMAAREQLMLGHIARCLISYRKGATYMLLTEQSRKAVDRMAADGVVKHSRRYDGIIFAGTLKVCNWIAQYLRKNGLDSAPAAALKAYRAAGHSRARKQFVTLFLAVQGAVVNW